MSDIVQFLFEVPFRNGTQIACFGSHLMKYVMSVLNVYQGKNLESSREG